MSDKEVVIIENTINYAMKCLDCIFRFRANLKKSVIGLHLFSDGRIAEAVDNGVLFYYPDGTTHFIHNNNFDNNGNRIL